MSYRTFFLLVFLVNTAAFAQSNVVTFEPTDTDPKVKLYNLDTDDVQVVNLKEYFSTAAADWVYYDPSEIYPRANTMSYSLTGNQNAVLTTFTYHVAGEDPTHGPYEYNYWSDWTISKQNMPWNPNWTPDEMSAAANGYGYYDGKVFGTYELAAAPGLGVDGDSYAVCYVMMGAATLDFMEPSDLEKIFVTNTTLTAANIVAGNSFSTPFTEEGNHFTLTIKGFTLGDEHNHVYSPDMTVEVPLAVFADGELNLLDSWKEVDLSAFIDVDGLDFTLETTDVDVVWGPNTPFYFAIDSLTFASAAPDPSGSGVPEPSTWALLILGMLGITVARKSMKQK